MTSPIVGEGFPSQKKDDAAKRKVKDDAAKRKVKDDAAEKEKKTQEPLAYDEPVVDVGGRIDELSAKLDSLMNTGAPAVGAVGAGKVDTSAMGSAIASQRGLTAMALATANDKSKRRIIEHFYTTQTALTGSLDDMQKLYKELLSKEPEPPEQQEYDSTYDSYLTTSMGVIANAFQVAAGAPAGAPSAGISATTSGLESMAAKQQQNAALNNKLYKSYSEAYKTYSKNMNSAFIKLVEKSTELEKAMLDNSFDAYKAELKARNENIKQAINANKAILEAEVDLLQEEQGRLNVNAQERNKVNIANLRASIENKKLMERAVIAKMKTANEDLRLMNNAFGKNFDDLTTEEAALLTKIGATPLSIDPYDFDRLPQQYRGSAFTVVNNVARELSDAKGAALGSLGAEEGWDLSTENEAAIKATVQAIDNLAANGIIVNKEGAVSISAYFDKNGDSEYLKFNPLRGVLEIKKPLTIKYQGRDGTEKTMPVASGQNIINAFRRAESPAEKDALSRALFGGGVGTSQFEGGMGSNEIIKRMGSRISNLSNHLFIKNYREAVEEGTE